MAERGVGASGSRVKTQLEFFQPVDCALLEDHATGHSASLSVTMQFPKPQREGCARAALIGGPSSPLCGQPGLTGRPAAVHANTALRHLQTWGKLGSKQPRTTVCVKRLVADEYIRKFGVIRDTVNNTMYNNLVLPLDKFLGVQGQPSYWERV